MACHGVEAMDLDIGRKVCRTVAPAGEIRISDAKEVFPVMLFPWKKKEQRHARGCNPGDDDEEQFNAGVLMASLHITKGVHHYKLPLLLFVM